MISRLLAFLKSIQAVALVCILTLALHGCSSSSDSSSAQSGSESSAESDTESGTESGAESVAEATNEASSTTGDSSNDTVDNEDTESVSETLPNDTESTSNEQQPSAPTTTQVAFNITVPAYSSDELLVQLSWGDINATAMWVRDETWVVSETLPTNTENPLEVTFADSNGAITLGTVETTFRTGTAESEAVEITAEQFNIDLWDNDNDGVNNLNELIAGTDPEVDDRPQPVVVGLELLPIKTVSITWQSSPDAEFYRVLENKDGISGFTDISNELDANTTNFEHQVALYSIVNAQYLVQSCNDFGCTDSGPVMVTSTLVSAMGYFKASNAEAEDRFGRSVSLSADGNILAIGAAEESSGSRGVNGDQSSNLVERSGAVYVFAWIDERWQQEAYLKASNTGSSDFFGSSVSLSADGEMLAVGAIFEKSDATGVNGDQSSNAVFNVGAVYVFTRSNRNWQQQAYLKASNAGFDDHFGSAVSMSADGNTLAVSSPNESSSSTGVNGDQDNDDARRSGAVYVFVNVNENWQQQAYLKASNTDLVIEADSFGDVVSLSGNGNTLAISAAFEDSAATGINGVQDDNSAENAGAVYMFTRSQGVWEQQAYIKANNASFQDRFGIGLSLSEDGRTLAVGAPFESGGSVGVNGDQNDDSSEQSGAVYIFTLNGDSWSEQAYLKASNNHSSDRFGTRVSLSSDGNILAVSAEGEDSSATGVDGNQSDNAANDSGAAYTFIRVDGIWSQQAYLKASNTDTDERFGLALSLSGDGQTLAIGADSEQSGATTINGNQNDNSSDLTGAVYLY